MSNVVHSTSGNTQWLLVCLQVCTLYMYMHVDGSSILYGRAVKFQHHCMAVDCRHPYAPARDKGGGGGGSGDQTARYLVPRLRV